MRLVFCLEETGSCTSTPALDLVDLAPVNIISQLPSTVSAGDVLYPYPAFEIRNVRGELVDARLEVTVRLFESSETLFGQAVLLSGFGLTNFTDLAVQTAGEYRLAFAFDADIGEIAETVSGPVTVGPSMGGLCFDPSNCIISVVQHPPPSVEAGTVFTLNAVVTDRYGNALTAGTVNITADPRAEILNNTAEVTAGGEVWFMPTMTQSCDSVWCAGEEAQGFTLTLQKENARESSVVIAVTPVPDVVDYALRVQAAAFLVGQPMEPPMLVDLLDRSALSPRRPIFLHCMLSHLAACLLVAALTGRHGPCIA